MPLILPENIPAFSLLKDFVFVMGEKRATHQDIRPLRIVIFNLMPTKIETENQLLSLLGNSPLQIEITLLKTKSYEGKNTPKTHLDKFYVDFKDIKKQKFDGAIITGAPIEHLAYEEVKYWEEFKEVSAFFRQNTTSSLYICWGAMAGLYFLHGINKVPLKNKLFGVFKHEKLSQSKILSGLDEKPCFPHSRHTKLDEKAILKNPNLKVLLQGKKAGISLVSDDKDFFMLAHPEYDKLRLLNEYERDLKKGAKIAKPQNYFDTKGEVKFQWRSSASVLFSNWLNFIYQETPFIL